MPYSKKYASRRSNRRFHKRNSKFSRYATYRHRSAKAQASQIYSLNKKINYVYKQTKPDIQFVDSVVDTKSFPCSAGLGADDAEHGQVHGVNMMLMNVKVNGEADSNYTLSSWLSGLGEGSESVRFRNGIVYVSISKGSDASLWGGKYGYQGPCVANIYVVQTLMPVTSMNAIFQSVLGESDNRGSTFIDSPLAPGSWKSIKILAKRRINLNSINATSKSIAIPFKPYRKHWSTSYSYTSSGGDNVQLNQNMIYVMYRVFGDSEDSNAHIHLYTRYRLYYTCVGTARPISSS